MCVSICLKKMSPPDHVIIEMYDILDMMESGEFALNIKPGKKISSWIYLYVLNITSKIGSTKN